MLWVNTMKQIKRILSICIAIVCCSIYLIGHKPKEKVVMVAVAESSLLEVVLMNKEGNLVPVQIEIPFIVDEPQAIMFAIEYMRNNRKYNDLYGFLNANAAINTITIDDTIAHVDVNSIFFSVNKRENRKIAEALVSVIKSNSTIEEIVLSEQGMMLETIPYTSISVKDMVYSLPMNVFESEDVLHAGIPFTKYSFKRINDKEMLIPITCYLKGDKNVGFVVDLFSTLLVNEGFFESHQKIINTSNLNKGKLVLDITNTLCFEENVIEQKIINLLLLMLFDNLPIKSIELSIEGEPYLYENRARVIHRKDLVYNIFKI